MLFHMDVPPLLPKPQGKPEAMTEMAKACRVAAKDLFASAQSAGNAVGSMSFTAPVASRIRGAVRGNAFAVSSVAEDLESFAAELETGATKLEDRIEKYEQRKEDHEAAKANNIAYEAAKIIAAERAAAAKAANPMSPSGPLFR